MEKKFRSKIELRLLIPVLLVLAIAEVLMIYFNIIIGVVAFAIITAFILYLCLDTFYVVTGDNRLRIKSGFLFHKEIYIKSIRRLRPTRDRHASPALSFDRLEISYNRYGRVVVSPGNKAAFIEHLTERNPRIDVEYKN